jgi:4-hydroxy-tetrahydrodipicolinate synthase
MNINSITLWTALITPLQENGELDLEGLTRLVRAQEQAGNGLLVLGSTGEALNLEEHEKEAVLKHVLGLNPKTPVMVGLSGSNLAETQKTLKRYNELAGVHAFLLVTPLYAKPGRHGQTSWFKTLLDASTKPCMLYNVPGRTGVALHEETVSDLKDHPKFFAIKEASGNPDQFRHYANAAGERIRMMSGDDALCPEFAAFSLKGLVSVASNCWPQATALYIEQVLNGTLKHIDLWRDSSNALFSASNPVPVKALMAKKGEIASNKLKAPLDERDMKQMDFLEAADQHIAQWLKNSL